MRIITREEAIKNYINNLSIRDFTILIDYINPYSKVPADWIFYDIDEFDEYMASYTPTEIALMIWFGNFNPNADYWQFDTCGHLVSLCREDVAKKLKVLQAMWPNTLQMSIQAIRHG